MALKETGVWLVKEDPMDRLFLDLVVLQGCLVQLESLEKLESLVLLGLKEILDRRANV